MRMTSFSFSSSSSSSRSAYSPSAPPLNHPEDQPQFGHPFPSAPPFNPPSDILTTFHMLDTDRSGYIHDIELQQALLSSNQRFCLRTIRLLIFLFKNPNQSSLTIGPQEFTALWSCLGQWRAIFEQFDRDRSGKIDTIELRDALHSLGYAIPQSVLQVLISRYDNGSGHRIELNFDEFIECGMVVKGLTDKFKEKDPRYTGSAMLHYDQFMSMIIPFLVCD